MKTSKPNKPKTYKLTPGNTPGTFGSKAEKPAPGGLYLIVGADLSPETYVSDGNLPFDRAIVPGSKTLVVYYSAGGDCVPVLPSDLPAIWRGLKQ